jgi:hypothetical protein
LKEIITKDQGRKEFNLALKENNMGTSKGSSSVQCIFKISSRSKERNPLHMRKEDPENFPHGFSNSTPALWDFEEIHLQW